MNRAALVVLLALGVSIIMVGCAKSTDSETASTTPPPPLVDDSPALPADDGAITVGAGPAQLALLALIGAMPADESLAWDTGVSGVVVIRPDPDRGDSFYTENGIPRYPDAKPYKLDISASEGGLVTVTVPRALSEEEERQIYGSFESAIHFLVTEDSLEEVEVWARESAPEWTITRMDELLSDSLLDEADMPKGFSMAPKPEDGFPMRPSLDVVADEANGVTLLTTADTSALLEALDPLMDLMLEEMASLYDEIAADPAVEGQEEEVVFLDGDPITPEMPGGLSLTLRPVAPIEEEFLTDLGFVAPREYHSYRVDVDSIKLDMEGMMGEDTEDIDTAFGGQFKDMLLDMTRTTLGATRVLVVDGTFEDVAEWAEEALPDWSVRGPLEEQGMEVMTLILSNNMFNSAQVIEHDGQAIIMIADQREMMKDMMRGMPEMMGGLMGEDMPDMDFGEMFRSLGEDMSDMPTR